MSAKLAEMAALAELAEMAELAGLTKNSEAWSLAMKHFKLSLPLFKSGRDERGKWSNNYAENFISANSARCFPARAEYVSRAPVL